MGASIKQHSRPSGGRRGRARRHAPMAEINVTPFVDVMLVLLVIFMVAAPLLATSVPVDLPETKGQSSDKKNDDPVLLTVAGDGRVYIGRDDRTPPIALAELEEKLKAIATARGGTGNVPIQIRGDKSASYGVWVQVMDRLKRAGFNKLALDVSPEGG